MTPGNDPTAEFFPKPTRPKKPRIWLGVLLALFIGASTFLVAVVVLWLAFVRGQSVEPTAADLDLIPDLSVLTPWMNGYTFTADHETFARTRYLDGSFDLEYTYDHPTDPDAPYFSYIVSFEPSEADARTVYHSYWLGLTTALELTTEFETEVDEDSVHYTWGDQSHFALLLGDGSPYGNAFASCDGTRAISVVISNFYFEDGESFAEFIEPSLVKLEPYADSLGKD